MGSANIYKTRFRWSTQILDVINFDTYYRITVKAENVNEAGSLIQIKIGYFVEDLLGNRYTISAVNLDEFAGYINVTDDFNNGFGPRIGEGTVYESVDLGDAPFIGPTKYENLDISAMSRALGIDMDIIWRNLYHYFRLSSEDIGYGYLYNWYALSKNTGGNSYGYLYNWYALRPLDIKSVNFGYLYNSLVLSNSSPIYAANAHVPSVAEWTALQSYLGGQFVAGAKLKETGTAHWLTPNTGSTNDVGFNAYGAGFRYYVTGAFSGIYDYTVYLASNITPTTISNCYISNNFDYFTIQPFLSNVINNDGCSIRLIVDTPNEIIDSTHAIYIGNDGQRYNCVLINGVWYTSQNLIETKYQDGSDIPEVTDNSTWIALTLGARCSYNNDSTLAYSKIATDTLISKSNAHVPSDAEWQALKDYLTTVSSGNEGGLLKEVGFTHWDSPNTGALDTYGFKALGSGYRFPDGTYSLLKHTGMYWSNTSVDSARGYVRYVESTSANLSQDDATSEYGISIRLIVDTPDIVIDSTHAIYIGNDEKQYKCVLINGVWWTAENLRETKYRDGTDIIEITDYTTWIGQTLGARCSYNNDLTLAYSPIITTTLAAYNAHVPSNDEWDYLQSLYGSGVTDSGGYLKEAGLTHWLTPNTGATNSSGLTVVGNGIRDSVGFFSGINQMCSFSTSDQYDDLHLKMIYLTYDSESFYTDDDYKIVGTAVRLIVDIPNIINPDLVTGTYIGNDSRVYKCKLMADGKWWTTENLIETKYNDGSPVPEIVDPTEWSTLTIGARCSYDNDPNKAVVTKLRVFSKDFVNFVDSETVSWSKAQVSPTEIQLVATAIGNTYVLPIATTVIGGNILGGIRVGTTLTINTITGVLDYILPVATTVTGGAILGGVIIGSGLSITAGGVLSAISSMVYPGAGIAVSTGSAWTTSLSVGSGLNTISNTLQLTYPVSGITYSTGSSWGTVTIGSGLSFSGGILSATGGFSMIYPSGTGMAWVVSGSSWGTTVTVGSGLNLDATTHVLTATGSGTMVWPASAGIALYSGSSSWATSVTVGSGITMISSILQLIYPSTGITYSTGSSWGTVTIGTGLNFSGGTLSATAGAMVYPLLTGLAYVSGGAAWGITVTIGTGLVLDPTTHILTATGGATMIYPAGTGLAWVNSGTSWAPTAITLGSGLTLSGSVLSASSMVWPPTTTAGLAYYNGTSGWNTSLTIGAGLAIIGGALTAGGGSGMTYPPAGLPVSTGTSWGSSFSMIAGVITFTGYELSAINFDLLSDRRKKTKIKDIPLEEMDLEYKEFEIISNPGQIRYGLIAQDVLSKYPQLVSGSEKNYYGIRVIDLLMREMSYWRNEVKKLRDERS